MDKNRFILIYVKNGSDDPIRQYVNVDHVVKIYENKKKEIILELSDYEELHLADTNIDVLMDRFK